MRRTPFLPYVTLALLVLVGFPVPVRADSATILEADPFRGRELFGEKGCPRCHSVWGHGGSLGPDIVVVVQGKTFYELVGDFWNHTPRMMDEVAQRGYAWPRLDAEEMADTLSYLYYLRLFDEPGDPERGEETYFRLQCGGCHTLAGEGGTSGGPLDRFGAYPSPTVLAQAMWNGGPAMQRAQMRRGSSIPQLGGDDIANLQAYIRAQGLRDDGEVILQPLPDPSRGARIFREKGCDRCHRDAGGRGPNIEQSALSKTVSEITGLLWNHSYAMSAEMSSQGVPFPRFDGTELSDLIAHLYFLGYAGEEGDASAGAEVFVAKGCSGCHEGGLEGVPDLTTGGFPGSRVALAAAMWNHAPQMHELMAERSPFWPKFEPGEMRDLAAFLARTGGDR